MSYKTINLKEDLSLYNNYKLCYIDEIDKVYYDYTKLALEYQKSPEFQEFKKEKDIKIKQQGYISSNDELYIKYDSILRKALDMEDVPNPEYIPGEQELYAYFTPASLKDQWGDDWNDAPYEHNAGIPYDKDYSSKNAELTIIKIPFIIKSYNARLPKDWIYNNSPFCIADINGGAVAWIFDYVHNTNSAVSIYAGCTPELFQNKLKEIETNNPDWIYYPPESDDD